MKAHGPQRGGEHPDVPLGAMQLCLSFQTLMHHVEDEKLLEAQDAAPVCANFLGFGRALASAHRDLELQAAYTPEHCAKLERLFLHMQAQVREYIDLLEQPGYLLHDQNIWQIRRLHRALVEVLVVVRGVCGLCATQRHMTEPTGSFWQLVDCVRLLCRECQQIATSFTKHTDIDTSVSVRVVLSA
jgi:hypothetical protein